MQPVSNYTYPGDSVFRIIAAIALGLILAPFVIVIAIISEMIKSSKSTNSSSGPDDTPAKDDRDTFGRKPGDSFHGYTVNDVTVLSEMESDAERSGLFRDTL